MRPPSRKLMYTDFIIQVIMLTPLVLVSLFCFVDGDAFLLAGFIQFFLGIWQVLSSLYTNFILKLKTRRIHLLLTVLFFAGAYGVFYVTEVLRPGIRVNEFVFSLALIVPQMIAIYYARQTYVDAMKLQKFGKVDAIKKELDEDILDSDMVSGD